MHFILRVLSHDKPSSTGTCNTHTHTPMQWDRARLMYCTSWPTKNRILRLPHPSSTGSEKHFCTNWFTKLFASPSHKVILEGARSAEPPMNSGSTLAMAFRQSCHSTWGDRLVPELPPSFHPQKKRPYGPLRPISKHAENPPPGNYVMSLSETLDFHSPTWTRIPHLRRPHLACCTRSKQLVRTCSSPQALART